MKLVDFTTKRENLARFEFRTTFILHAVFQGAFNIQFECNVINVDIKKSGPNTESWGTGDRAADVEVDYVVLPI